jgi:hypothetical protein
LRAFCTASPLNVAVIQGSQDAWQADLLAAALLLFTRFTADPRTALAFVAFRVAQFAYVPPPPSFVRATHFTAMLLRHEARHNSAPLRLRFLIVHSVPALDAAGGCRPLLELLDEDGAPLWSNGGCRRRPSRPTSSGCARCRTFRRVAATRRCRFRSSRRRSSTATSRCASTHIDAGDRARHEATDVQRVAPHGVHRRRGLVLRLASSQFDVRPEVRGEIDDEFALDLIFAAEEGGRVAEPATRQLLKLPTDVDRCGECLFPNGEIDVVTTKRAFAAFTDKPS